MNTLATIFAPLVLLTYSAAAPATRLKTHACGGYLNVERISSADSPRFTERLERATTYADLIALRHLSRAEGLRWDWRPWSGTVRIDFPLFQTSYPDELLALIGVLALAHDGRAYFTADVTSSATATLPDPLLRVATSASPRAPVDIELFSSLNDALVFADLRVEDDWRPQIRWVEVRDTPSAIRDLRTRLRRKLARYR